MYSGKLKVVACLMGFLGFSILAFAQTPPYDFTKLQSKANLEFEAANPGWQVVHIKINGIADDNKEQALKQKLGTNPNIKTIEIEDHQKCKLVLKKEYTAPALRKVLLEQQLDFDFSTLIINNYNWYNVAFANRDGLPSDFPKFIDTGDFDADIKNYSNEKKRWIQDNPERYKNLFHREKSKEEIELDKIEHDNKKNN